MTGAMVVATRAGWAVVTVLSLALLVRGVWFTIHFEPTSDALAEERQGYRLIVVGCVMLTCCALAAALALGASSALALAVAVPVPAALWAFSMPLVSIALLLAACVIALAAVAVMVTTRR